MRETLPQTKQLERASVTVAYVGPGADADASSPALRDGQKLTILEDEALASYFDHLGPTERQRAAQARADAPAHEQPPPMDEN